MCVCETGPLVCVRWTIAPRCPTVWLRQRLGATDVLIKKISTVKQCLYHSWFIFFFNKIINTSLIFQIKWAILPKCQERPGWESLLYKRLCFYLTLKSIWFYPFWKKNKNKTMTTTCAKMPCLNSADSCLILSVELWVGWWSSSNNTLCFYLHINTWCAKEYMDMSVCACVFKCVLTGGPSMPGSPSMPCFPWGPCIGQRHEYEYCTGVQLLIWKHIKHLNSCHTEHFPLCCNILYSWLNPLLFLLSV